jgi:hypothetical protein
VTGRWKCFCVVTATTHQNSEKLPAWSIRTVRR